MAVGYLINIPPKALNAYGYIYRIINLINLKIYIGQTTLSPENRFKLHCSLKDKTMPISHAIKKYGKENFTIEVIAVCSNKNNLNEFEKKCIKKYKSQNTKIGYNICEGGYSGVTKEGAKKISLALKGKPKSKEHNLKVKLSNLGKKRSEETKANIKKSKTETVGKKVTLINLNTKEIFHFNSIHEASRKLNLPKSCFRRLLTNVKYTYKDFRAFYQKDNVDLTNNLFWEKCKIPLNSVKVKITNKETQEIHIFNSKKDAAKFLNVSHCSIERRLNGATRKDKNLHIFTFERI